MPTTAIPHVSPRISALLPTPARLRTFFTHPHCILTTPRVRRAVRALEQNDLRAGFQTSTGGTRRATRHRSLFQRPVQVPSPPDLFH